MTSTRRGTRLPAALAQRGATGAAAVVVWLVAACSSTPMPAWDPRAAMPDAGRAARQAAPPAGSSPSTPMPTPVQTPEQSAAPITPPESPLSAITQALVPDSPAVEARFPDPKPADMPGPAEWDERLQPLGNADLRARLQRLVNEDTAGHAAPTVGWLPMGPSQRGESIDALVVTSGSDATPAGLAATGRPTVLFVAGQHGDEPAGTQALLIVATQLAAGRWKTLLEQVNVVIVARANPDGAAAGTRVTADGTDLNRDHLLLRTPEARALAKLRQDVDPAVVVDAHEYPASTALYAPFGALPRADALLQASTTANLPPFIAKAAEEWFRSPLAHRLNAAGLTVDWYSAPVPDAPEPHVSMGNVRPDSLRNVVGLSQGVGLLVESRGADLGTRHWRRRLYTQVTAAVDVLRSAAAHSADLVKLRSFVGNDVASQACTGVAVIEAATTASEYTLQWLDPVTGADKPVVVAWDSALELRNVSSRPRPCGYWLAASQSPAVDRLRLLGVRVQQLSEAGELRSETYRSPAEPTAPAPSSARRRWTTTAMLLDVPAGSYYVGLNQPLASLALAALEPDSPHGYVANGLITDTGGGIARVMLRPQMAATPLP